MTSHHTSLTAESLERLNDDDFKNIIVRFVRTRDKMSSEEIDALLHPDIADRTHQQLISLKRDLEHQFTAHRARMADFDSQVHLARENGELTITVGGDDEGVDLPLSAALPAFRSKELRWKVRTNSFMSLIESRIQQVSSHTMRSVVRELLLAVDYHEKQVQPTSSAADLELYETATDLRKRLL